MVRAAAAFAVAATLTTGACAGGGGDDGATTTTVDVAVTPATAPEQRATEAEVPVPEGGCYDLDGLGAGLAVDPAALRPVACEGPHTVEVAAVLDHPLEPGSRFPGGEAVDGFATEACLERFEAYVGAPYEASRLDVAIVAPDEAGWVAGDRRIACLLYDIDFVPLPGPARGSAR
ncbi:MAG: septum formation family protein [Acidimicrobiales bacterium]